jgi:hypothetical protein
LALDSNDVPVMAHWDELDNELRVTRCSSPSCLVSPTTATPDPDSGGAFPSIAIDRTGNPVISYYEGGAPKDLKVLYCLNPGCSGAQAPIAADRTGVVGEHTSLALDSLGNAVVAYYAPSPNSQDLRVLHCYNAGDAVQTSSSGEPCGGQDQDLDGVRHSQDNCPQLANPQQADANNDGEGDDCDTEPPTAVTAIAADRAAMISWTAPVSTSGQTITGYRATATPGNQFCETGGSTSCVISELTNATTYQITVRARTATGLGPPSTPPTTVTPRTNAPAQIPTCFGRPATILAMPGQTTIGTSGPDVIVGTKGPDTIRGRGGNDRICSRAGNDNINGNKGRDRINAGPGKDTANGNNGNDIINGNKGRDTLNGNKGRDTLNGGKGRDTCNGGKGKDTLTSC